MIQGGQTRAYYHDSHGRLKKETFSTLGIETRTFYDLAGNVEEMWEKVDSTPAWKKSKYTTDYLGRKLSMTTANPKDDPLYSEVTTSYVRDAFGQGRLERVDLPAVGGIIDSYEYEYDLGGREVLSIDPNGTQIEQVYDPSKGYLDYVNIFHPEYPNPAPTWFWGPSGCNAGFTFLALHVR